MSAQKSSPSVPATGKGKGSAIKQMAPTLSLVGFFSITASMVLTVYEYPTFASSGFSLVFFLIVGGFLWFIPVALVAAEMATVKGWENGGIFSWVGDMIGKRFGFASLFYQWAQVTVCFCTMSFFILAAVGFVFNQPAFYENPLVMFICVAIIVWVLTFVQMGGTKLTAKIAKIGFFGGIVTPAVVLFIGMIAYLATGGTVNVDFSPEKLIPNFSNVDTLVIFASFILAYCGVEASASHVNELENPQRNYPLAMFMLVIVAIVLDTLGGLTVAITTPVDVLNANLSYGVIDSFKLIFINQLGEGWAWIVYVIAILIILGVLAEISGWIVGPSRAFLTTAQKGILPASFAKVNKNGISVKTLVVQAVVVTIWDAVLCGSIALSGGSSSSVGYLTAIGLTVVIYLVAYTMLFISYLKLTYKHPELERAYHIPGGKGFKTVVAIVGLFMTIATLIISFFPPSQLSGAAGGVYEATLIICFLVVVAIPFVIYALHHNWSGVAVAGASAATVSSLNAADSALKQAEIAIKNAEQGVNEAREFAYQEALQAKREASATARAADRVAKAADLAAKAAHKPPTGQAGSA